MRENPNVHNVENITPLRGYINLIRELPPIKYIGFEKNIFKGNGYLMFLFVNYVYQV